MDTHRAAIPLTLAVLACAAALLHAAGAGAGSPGTWSRVSDPGGMNSDEVALARTGDGALHVLWRRGAAAQDLRHATVSAAGQVGNASDVLRGWSALGNPYLLRDGGGGLRAFFGGIRSNQVREPISVNTATAPASGASWSVQQGSAGGTRLQVSDVGGALAKDGTPISAWSDTAPGSNGWHFGVDGTQPGGSYQDRCCTLANDLAVDRRSGQVVLVWYSTAAGSRGIFAQPVGPTATAGPKRLAPGSVTSGNAVVPTHRIGVVERGGGGIYVAYGSGYPSFGRAVLWRVGAKKPLAAVAATGAEHVNLGAGPDGRLWLMWERGGTLFFSRTNRAASRLGRIVSARPPAGTSRIWRLKGEGSRGQPLDVLAHATVGGSIATWHTQVLPGLQLDARVQSGRVSFLAHEAGDAVRGAVVTTAGRRLVTDARGRATARTSGGTHLARATKAGYQAVELRVRVG